MTNTNKKKFTSISFEEFELELNKLISLELSHFDLYYNKLDLHFGEYKNKDGEFGGDLTLYVTGHWEVIDSGKTIINEMSNAEKIKEFFEKMINKKIISIKIFEDNLELFIEFSNKLFLHIIKENENNWIELLKRNGELTYLDKDQKMYRGRH